MRLRLVIPLLLAIVHSSVFAQPVITGVSENDQREGRNAAEMTSTVATTTILIPIIYDGPGAFGSRWWTRLIVSNFSAQPFTTPGVTFVEATCVFPSCPESPVLAPGQSSPIVRPISAPHGLLLRGPADVASDLSFRADFGRSDGTFDWQSAVELPVVREREFSTRALHFTDAPLFGGGSWVTTLRIYGIDALPGTTVRLQLRRSPHDPPVAERLVQLEAPPATEPSATPLFPAYAQMNLQHEFPMNTYRCLACIVSVVPVPREGSGPPRIWAFLSATFHTSGISKILRPQ